MKKKLLTEREETVRELKSHMDHVIIALNNSDFNRAQFHIDNAKSCMDWITREVTLQVKFGGKSY